MVILGFIRTLLLENPLILKINWHDKATYNTEIEISEYSLEVNVCQII